MWRNIINHKLFDAPTKKWGTIIESMLLSHWASESLYLPSAEQVRYAKQIMDDGIISARAITLLSQKIEMKLGASGTWPELEVCSSEEITKTLEVATTLISVREMDSIKELWLHDVNLSQIRTEDLKKVFSHVRDLGKHKKKIKLTKLILNSF